MSTIKIKLNMKPITLEEINAIPCRNTKGVSEAIREFLASDYEATEIDTSKYATIITARNSINQIISKYFKGKVGLAKRGDRLFLIRKEK